MTTSTMTVIQLSEWFCISLVGHLELRAAGLNYDDVGMAYNRIVVPDFFQRHVNTRPFLLR